MQLHYIRYASAQANIPLVNIELTKYHDTYRKVAFAGQDMVAPDSFDTTVDDFSLVDSNVPYMGISLTEHVSSKISLARAGSAILSMRSGSGTSTSLVKETPKGNICVFLHLIAG